MGSTLQWRHNGRDGVSNHQPHQCLLNRLFGRRSKKTSKLRVTGLCARNSPWTGEFLTQMASNAENVSIWWRYRETRIQWLLQQCLIQIPLTTWWRHQMETFSALLALCAGNSPVTGEFPSQRPVTPSFDVFFDLHLDKRDLHLNKSRRRWFEMPSRSLLRHCNVSALMKEADGCNPGVLTLILSGQIYRYAYYASLSRWPRCASLKCVTLGPYDGFGAKHL